MLVAVILNGIYLKDLHHILQLDRWRENYRENVSTWLDTIQRFDALVSMGNLSLQPSGLLHPGS